jgi:hypothetical protein
LLGSGGGEDPGRGDPVGADDAVCDGHLDCRSSIGQRLDHRVSEDVFLS